MPLTIKSILVPGIVALAASQAQAQEPCFIRNISSRPWTLIPVGDIPSVLVEQGKTLTSLSVIHDGPLAKGQPLCMPARQIAVLDFDTQAQPKGAAFFEVRDHRGRNPLNFTLACKWDTSKDGAGMVMRLFRTGGASGSVGSSLMNAGLYVGETFWIGPDSYEKSLDLGEDVDYVESFFSHSDDDGLSALFESLDVKGAAVADPGPEGQAGGAGGAGAAPGPGTAGSTERKAGSHPVSREAQALPFEKVPCSFQPLPTGRAPSAAAGMAMLTGAGAGAGAGSAHAPLPAGTGILSRATPGVKRDRPEWTRIREGHEASAAGMDLSSDSDGSPAAKKNVRGERKRSKP